MEVSTTVKRSASDGFNFVADYERDPRWRIGVVAMRHDPPGPVHVGMRTHEVMRFFGRTIKVTAEIVALETGHRVSFRSLTGPLQVEGDRTVDVASSGARVTYAAVAHLTGLLGLLAPLVTRSFRRRALGDLARLKRILETPSAGEAS